MTAERKRVRKKERWREGVSTGREREGESAKVE